MAVAKALVFPLRRYVAGRAFTLNPDERLDLVLGITCVLRLPLATAACLFLTTVPAVGQDRQRSHLDTSSVTAVWKDGTNSELEIEAGNTYVIPASVTTNLRGLTIRGLRDAKLHFAGSIRAAVTTKSPWQEDRGVVNLTDCRNLEISGLEVTNTKKYLPTLGVGNQESTALCVSRSQHVSLANAVLIGNGKAVLVVHSGSVFSIQDSRLAGYYFELLAGASTVTLGNVTFDQHNPAVADSHAAIWVSSSMRNDATKQLFEETKIALRNVTFNLKSGRAIVCGNGSYETESTIIFENPPEIRHHYPAIGYAIFHSNYHSHTVTFKQKPVAMPDIVDARGGHGIARFIVYHDRPGAPSSKSPIVVDGVSSESIAHHLSRR